MDFKLLLEQKGALEVGQGSVLWGPMVAQVCFPSFGTPWASSSQLCLNNAALLVSMQVRSYSPAE